MDLDIAVKLAVYRMTAASGRIPSAEAVAADVGATRDEVIEAFRRLRASRLLFLEEGGAAIRMAPPFSAVPTQHRVHVDGVDYFANCGWDALGIIAALHRSGVVHSRCGQSGEPLHLAARSDGPERSEWLFHCLVPAAAWWDDLVFT